MVVEMLETGRLIVLLGFSLLVVGVVMMLLGRFHLPSDFAFRRGEMVFLLPLATSVIASVVLTILLNLLLRST